MAFFKYKTTNMYYETIGEGQSVLLIHGWGIDHNYFIGCMEPIFKELQSGFQRYYVDLPGIGKSEAGFVINADDYVEVLSAFLQQVVADKQVLLIGNSFGGKLACGIAHQLPELIRGMILIAGSTGCTKREQPLPIIFKKDEEFLSTLTNEQREDFCALSMTLTKKAWTQYKKYIYPAVLHSKTNDFLNHTADDYMSYDLYEQNPEQQFNKPVLFVTGKQDTSVGFEDPFELSKCYPQSSFTAIHGAGHNIWLDQPEPFHDTVLSWIRCNMLQN